MRTDGGDADSPGFGKDVGVSAGCIGQLIDDWSALWLPPERLQLADWAEKNFYLSSKYSAKSGLIELYGFQREPFNAFTDPRVSEIVLKVSTQMLKTILIQAAVAYIISEAPGPTLITQPSDSDAFEFSRERLSPMTQDCPALASKIAFGRTRDVSNSTLYKEFPGGSLSIVGAVSPANAARRTIQYLLCDEVNKYPASAGDEGSFVELADERTTKFRSRAKRVYSCSPTTPKGIISRKYELSDQRRPWVPCHACGERQVLKWIRVRWDRTLPFELQAQSAYYECEHCLAPWNDVQRRAAAENVQWRAEKPFRGVAGFWINHLYSPDKKLSEIVQKFINAQATGDVNDLKVFINTNLGEEWVEQGEAPEYEKLLNQREDYLGAVPAGALLVTAGADVHPDRIEVEVVGWGRRRESWSIDYVILDGRTSEPEVWQKLELLLGEVFVSASGAEMPISRIFVDSGHATNDVYSWVRHQNSARVVAIKGQDHGLLPVGPPSPVDVTVNGRKIKSGLKIKTVQVSYFKGEFYSDLHKRRPTDEELAAGAPYPPGYCHFPKDGNYGDEHFKQICSESLVTTRDRKGRERREWRQNRPRNEALDCRIYARAAAWDLGMDRFKEHHWSELEGRRGPEPAPPPQEEAVIEFPPAPEQTQGPLFQPSPAVNPVTSTVSIASAQPTMPVSPALFAARRTRMQIRLGGF
jgi:phage terminase large subunit GpA-like protein